MSLIRGSDYFIRKMGFTSDAFAVSLAHSFKIIYAQIAPSNYTRLNQ
jgi:hypothetical protein